MNVKSNYTLLTSIFWLVKYNSLLIYLNILIFQAFYKMTGFFQAFYKMPEMKRQATRMRNLSERILSDVDIGTNVLIPIPNVDWGKGDTRNVLAVVINKDELGYKPLLTAGLKESSFSLFIDPMSKNLLSDSSN
jgi:hypothetical protein